MKDEQQNEQEDQIVYDEEIVESNEDGTELSGSDQVKKLRDKIKVLTSEKQEYLDGWQRSRADYANVLKTADEDKKRLRSIIEANFVEDLIPTVDSFALAMNNKEAWEKVDANWRVGVEYIYSGLMNTLKEKGFTAFGVVGEKFDPTLHEAVSDTPTDDATLDQTIASVLQQGYRLNDNILRAARVSVYSLNK
ncbi:nucleotide exchange factor GrpE [Patescibacteria group bacterium]|nr:nucleotide exchange factor GrpE [Patescibacteria group bacterium]